MTNTYLIRVIVDPGGAIRGLNKIAQSLDSLEGKASRVGGYFRTLFALDMARRAVGGVIKLADAYADLEAKTRLASGKNDLLTISMDKVFRAANRARTDVGAFGKTVLAIAGATANMNLGFDASIRMTETLSKMMRLGGSSTAEARSSVTQYGQAMRKGKLDSDEFRSVMENSLPLQQALAKQLGISTDQLSKFSKAGKITRSVMVDALIKSADEVDRQFAMMSMRVADAWTVIHNSATKFVGEMRLNEKIAPILLFIADHFDVIAKSAMVAANVIGTFFVRKGIAFAIEGLTKLAALMVANPFLVLTYGIVAAVAALRIFGAEWKVANDGVATFRDLFDELASNLTDVFDTVLGMIGEGIENLAAMFGELIDLSDISFKDIVVFGAIMADKFIVIITFMKDTVINLFAAMAEQAINAVNKMIDGINDLGTRLSKTRHFVGLITNEYKGTDLDPNVNDADRKKAWDVVTRDHGAGWDGRRSMADLKNAAELAEQLSRVRYQAATDQMYGGKALGSVPNPFSGSSSALLTKDEDALEKLRVGVMNPTISGRAEDAVLSFFERVEKRALGRKPDDRRGLGEAGKAGEPPVDEKARKAREKALRDYEALESSISVVYKAELELANAQEVLNKAMDMGIVTQERAAFVMARKREMLEAQLDPYQEMIRLLDREVIQTKNLNGDWNISADLLARLSKLRNDGVEVTNDEIVSLAALMRLQRGLSDDQKRKQELLSGAGYVSADEQKAYALAQAYHRASSPEAFQRSSDVINASTFQPHFVDSSTQKGRTEIYRQKIQDIVNITKQWEKEGASQNAILAGTAAMMEQVNQQMGILTEKQQSVGQGLKDGWKATFFEMGSTAAQTAQVVGDAFRAMKDAVVDFVTTGKFNFMDLFNVIMKGMADIATQRLFSELMRLAGGTSPVNGLGGIGVGSGGTFGDNLMQPTFAAKGGLFRVSGPPGVDQVPVSMMLSNHEQLAVWPRGKGPSATQAPASHTNVIVVQDTQSAMLQVMQSPVASRTQIRNMTHNEAYLRALQRRA